MGALKDFPGKNLAQAICDLAPLKDITQSFTFVYKGQKPNVALFIKTGKVLLGKEEFTILPGEKGRLIYFDELLNGRTSLFNLEVLKGSQVSIIDKKVAEQIVAFTCLKSGKKQKT